MRSAGARRKPRRRPLGGRLLAAVTLLLAALLVLRFLVADEVGVLGMHELRAWMEEMESVELVSHLIGGVAVSELPV